MRILGIDPGTHRIGWGVIEGDLTDQTLVEAGCIDLPHHTQIDTYLHLIHQQISQLIQQYQPQKVGVEKIFFQKNVKTAINVAQARGVILLAIAQNSLPIIELSPNTIKSAVTGNGQADKQQVAQMVSLLLDLDQSFKLDDTYDALATAIATLFY